MTSPIYAQDGVNVSLGDQFSAFARTIIVQSDRNSPYVEVRQPVADANFRSPRMWRYRDLPDGLWQTKTADGVGTKTVIHDAAGTMENAACDLLAMVIDDITRYGGLPLVFSNILELKTFGDNQESEPFRRAQKAMETLGLIAASHNVVLATGETAEMSVCIGSASPDSVCPFNWAATASGVYEERRMITGNGIKQNDYIVALREYGFRSNGISTVRKAFAQQFGDDWMVHPEAQEALKLAAAPSIPYTALLTTANGWYNYVGDDRLVVTGKLQPKQLEPLVPIKAIVHLTGGAFQSKLGHDLLFPRGFSARLTALYDLPDIMRLCADWREMTDQDVYETWNGGQGALVIMDGGDYRDLSRLAEPMGIELQYCGSVENAGRNGPEIIIESKYQKRETVTFR